MRKKSISVQKLTKEFKETVAGLPAGATVDVTHHGEVIAHFTKASPLPDLEKALAPLDRVPYPKSEGQRLINSILKDVA